MSDQVDDAMNSTAMRTIIKLAQVALIPALLWFAASVTGLEERMTAVEQVLKDKLPDVYPRGEATAALLSINQRVDGVVQIQREDTRRLEALESARNRLR